VASFAFAGNASASACLSATGFDNSAASRTEPPFVACVLLLRIDFIDIPPDRAEAFAGDLAERRAIDSEFATDLHNAYGSELNQASTSFLAWSLARP
jgi:hypothetical protein